MCAHSAGSAARVDEPVKKWQIHPKRHTRESREPEKHWTPAPVPDTDPAFAGTTTFAECVRTAAGGVIVKRSNDRDAAMRTTNTPIDNRGFTLIEITVAVFLLVAALLSLISTTVIVIKSNSLGHTMTSATTLAGDKMEQFKNTVYSDLAGGAGTDYATMDSTVQTTSTAETIFTRTWTITSNSPVAGMKTIAVTVQWNWQGASRNVSLTSLVAN